jgi:uncharacterized membrane protein YozB (DUF420 family)
LSFRDLPTLNAILNLTSAVLLSIGYVLIRRRCIETHRKVMWSAFACSTLFLISYLIYHSQAGSVRFQKQGTIRNVYFAILLSHTVLAAAVPPLAVLTLRRAVRTEYPQHRRLARWTLPIWLYVSVTGVAVYWMLYRM